MLNDSNLLASRESEVTSERVTSHPLRPAHGSATVEVTS